jgi:hypothetical protein
MSKGHGRLQRAILDAFEALHARQMANERQSRKWARRRERCYGEITTKLSLAGFTPQDPTTDDLASYALTREQRSRSGEVSLRRALNDLVVDGLVERIERVNGSQCRWRRLPGRPTPMPRTSSPYEDSGNGMGWTEPPRRRP